MSTSFEIFPVIHADTNKQMIEQATLVVESDADGMFLINHGAMSDEDFLTGFMKVKQQIPDSYIGVNLLSGSGYSQFFNLLQAKDEGIINFYPDALWVDGALELRQEVVDLRRDNPELQAIKYLGGVAFKYTDESTDDPVYAAEQASEMSPFVDVVTSSGRGTGEAASAEKMYAMKQAIGSQKLALASGVTIENIDEYRGVVDQILVSTSVETAPMSGIFDQDKLFKLVAAAHNS